MKKMKNKRENALVLNSRWIFSLNQG